MPDRCLVRLAACAGDWRGTSTLQDPGAIEPETTPSSLTITSPLGGRFVRIDYTWSYQGKPQEGSLLVGFDPRARAYSGHWIDTWHMSHKVMALEGAPESDGALNLRGSYPAPPGPDWGWRIIITPDPQAFRMVMVNIWPDGGREDLAVEASYTRAAEASSGA